MCWLHWPSYGTNSIMTTTLRCSTVKHRIKQLRKQTIHSFSEYLLSIPPYRTILRLTCVNIDILKYLYSSLTQRFIQHIKCLCYKKCLQKRAAVTAGSCRVCISEFLNLWKLKMKAQHRMKSRALRYYKFIYITK
jgi:hypothetical protein